MAYDNPHGLIAAAVIVQTLVLSMIVSRFASHRIKGVKLYASDYFIIAAGLLSSALAIEKIYCTSPARDQTHTAQIHVLRYGSRRHGRQVLRMAYLQCA